MRRVTAAAFVVATASIVLGSSPDARAASDDDASLFQSATKALQEGRAGESIADFEALADRGVLDPVVSLDRGLAYAERVRIGGEQPGDLGRAAQSFEEARGLAAGRDEGVVRDATAALTLVRGEVARRRARAGEPVELDEGASLDESIVHLLPEDVWAVLAMLCSVLAAIALFVRGATTRRRLHVGATATAAVVGPLLFLFGGLLLAARDDRLHRRDAIVVNPNARPADARGIALPGKPTLPEGARVRVLASGSAGFTEVRWRGADVWLPAAAVRPIARVD